MNVPFFEIFVGRKMGEYKIRNTFYRGWAVWVGYYLHVEVSKYC
ncbi:hypothetical protein BLA24064_02100 [Burkholderia latens]|uniref:Uncharacterized protein n=1 Tax=Burkholderia latens TaxID=488446 RepID=A0A6P2JU59_9BURK|nr:hypothetical protein BLA24064_02100 [Burkholderia latens]